MKIKPFVLAVIGMTAISAAFAQTLDQSFSSPLPIRAADIRVIQVQPDGKVLLGGDIAFYGTQRVHNLIRIHADGSLDSGFSFPRDDFRFSKLALLPSGEIIALASRFDPYNSAPLSGGKIFKINPDGSINKEIDLSASLIVSVIAVDGNGKILMGAGGLKRYNSDLTPDPGFSDVTTNAGISSVAFTGDKILVSGSFSQVNGVSKNDIARLNADGTLDNTFDTGTGTTDMVGAITIQSDGKILLGETYMNSFNGTKGRGLMRLNADGSVDTGFQPPVLNGPVNKAVVTNDGIYAAAFFYFNASTKNRLFRLKADGSQDTAFAPVDLDDGGASHLRVAVVDGKVVFNNSQAFGNIYGLSKVNTNGSYDRSFAPPVSRYGTIAIADIFGGKMLVAGDFIRINGIETYGVARLQLNGAVDESFLLKENKGVVHQLKVLDDENVLVSTRKNFFKLGADGNEKPDFHWSQFKTLYQIEKFIVLPDGKIMAGDANLVYRLNADGSEDPSFSIANKCCINSTLFDFDMQGDKTIYGSAFISLGGVPVNRLARLTPQGSVDPGFNPGSGPDAQLSLIKVLDNNEVLVGGLYTIFDGKSVSLPLVKLSANGALDSIFYTNLQNSTAQPPSAIVRSRRVAQLGSRIFFQTLTGIYAIGIDGKPDPGFTIPAAIGTVSDIITLRNTVAGGRTKTDSGFLFALGSFRPQGSESPAFILKLQVGAGLDPEPDPDPNPDPDPVTNLEQPAATLNTFAARIYPNPVQDRMQLKVAAPDGNFSVAVFDLSGRNYLQSTVAIKNGTSDSGIDLQHAPPGIYVLKLVSEKGRSAFVKFAKMH